MEGEDLVSFRTGGTTTAGSEFSQCYGEFTSRNNCFAGRPERLNRKIGGKELSYAEVKSCQGSSISWCKLAVDGVYDQDPHDDPDGVWSAQSQYEKLPTIGSDWDKTVAAQLSALELGLTAVGLQIKGDIARSNRAADAVQEASLRSGVLLIISEAYHATAAAFTSGNAVYYYDNDVGCCRCPDITVWKKWVQWCDEKMLDGRWAYCKPPHHLLFMNIEKAT